MPESIAVLADQPPDKLPRRRWRWPVALKVFAGILLVLGAYSGWIIWRGYRQLAAIEKIEQLADVDMKKRFAAATENGDGIGFFNFNSAVTVQKAGPDWLRQFLGDDRIRMFDRVTKVSCHLESPDPGLFREIGRWTDLNWLEINLGTNDLREIGRMNPSRAREKLSQYAELHRTTNTGFEHLRHLEKLQIVYFKCPLVADHEVEWIGDLPNLYHVNFDFSPITDATALQIAKLSRLEHLGLSCTLITDDGIRHFAKLTRLGRLDLSRNRISGAGFAHLQDLTKLMDLNLSDTEITDAGLLHLRQFSKLKILDLSNNRIHDEGMVHLSRLDLAELNLNETEITDVGLAQLDSMENLTELYLASTKITDAGLLQLQKLNRLRVLVVNRTQVTVAGVAELNQALPALRVAYDSE